MIVGNDVYCRRIKHQGAVVDLVVEAANDLIELAPKSMDKALEWKGINLSEGHKFAYAEAAMNLKWEENDEGDFPLNASQLLEVSRNADKGSDLWTTFNVVQEKIIRGGIRYRTEKGDRQRTRAVNSVSENVRLNTALWTLTEKMAELIK